MSTVSVIVSDWRGFYSTVQQGSEAWGHLEDALDVCANAGDTQMTSAMYQGGPVFGLTFHSTMTKARPDLARCVFTNFVDSVPAELKVLDVVSSWVISVCHGDGGDGAVGLPVQDISVSYVTASVGLSVLIGMLVVLICAAGCVACCRHRRLKSRGLRNDAGARVHFGAKGQSGSASIYCGAYSRSNDFGSETGYCGPRVGPQCASCARLRI